MTYPDVVCIPCLTGDSPFIKLMKSVSKVRPVAVSQTERIHHVAKQHVNFGALIITIIMRS